MDQRGDAWGSGRALAAVTHPGAPWGKPQMGPPSPVFKTSSQAPEELKGKRSNIHRDDYRRVNRVSTITGYSSPERTRRLFESRSLFPSPGLHLSKLRSSPRASGKPPSQLFPLGLPPFLDFHGICHPNITLSFETSIKRAPYLMISPISCPGGGGMFHGPFLS